MQEAFGIVIFAVVALGSVAAALSLLGRDKLYEQIGRGGLSLNEDDRPASSGAGPVGDDGRDDEIRQLLIARNARRAARGEAEEDVEAELGRQKRPQIDSALRAEVRDLVIARNARRHARGLAALDVDAEVERQMSRL